MVESRLASAPAPCNRRPDDPIDDSLIYEVKQAFGVLVVIKDRPEHMCPGINGAQKGRTIFVYTNSVSVLWHELAHYARMRTCGVTPAAYWNDKSIRAREELVAEITSLVLTRSCLAENAAYTKHILEYWRDRGHVPTPAMYSMVAGTVNTIRRCFGLQFSPPSHIAAAA